MKATLDNRQEIRDHIAKQYPLPDPVAVAAALHDALYPIHDLRERVSCLVHNFNIPGTTTADERDLVLAREALDVYHRLTDLVPFVCQQFTGGDNGAVEERRGGLLGAIVDDIDDLAYAVAQGDVFPEDRATATKAS